MSAIRRAVTSAFRFSSGIAAISRLQRVASVLAIAFASLVGIGAFASAAEYKTCQAEPGGGKFEDNECKKPKANGGFEWKGLQPGEKIETMGGGTIFEVETVNTAMGCDDVKVEEELKPAGSSIGKLKINTCTVKELVGGRVVRTCNAEAGTEPIGFETTGALNAALQVELVPKGGGNEFFEIQTEAGVCNKNAFKLLKKAGGSWNCAVTPVTPTDEHTITCGGCKASNKLEFNGEAVVRINGVWATKAGEEWKLG